MALLHAAALVLALGPPARQAPDERAAEEARRFEQVRIQAEEQRRAWERAEAGLREDVQRRLRAGTLDGLREALAERRAGLFASFTIPLFCDLDRALAVRDAEGRMALAAHAVGMHALALPGLSDLARDERSGNPSVRFGYAYDAACSAVHVGDDRAALELLAFAAELVPTYGIADLARKQRARVEAFSARRDDPAAWLEFVDEFWLGSGVGQAREWRDAEEMLLEARTRFAGNMAPALLVRLHQRLLCCRVQRGDVAAAEAWLASIAADLPGDDELRADARLMIADGWVARGERELAAARYASLLADQPGARCWADAELGLADLRQQTGDLAGAIRGFEEILARNDSAPSSQRTRGLAHRSHLAAERISACYERLGKLEPALAFARRALELPFDTFCGTCADSEDASDRARVARLEELVRAPR